MAMTVHKKNNTDKSHHYLKNKTKKMSTLSSSGILQTLKDNKIKVQTKKEATSAMK